MKTNSKARARAIISNKRKGMKDYKNKTKKELLLILNSYIANFGDLRNNYIDILLENDFLKRKLEMTEEKVKILSYGNHHSFKQMNKRRSKNERKKNDKNNRRSN